MNHRANLEKTKEDEGDSPLKRPPRLPLARPDAEAPPGRPRTWKRNPAYFVITSTTRMMSILGRSAASETLSVYCVKSISG